MGLTKADIQLLKGMFTEQMREIDKRFIMQGKSIVQGFTDLKAVMENTYVSREEFEQVKAELQNEVDDLKKQVQALQKSIHTPS